MEGFAAQKTFGGRVKGLTASCVVFDNTVAIGTGGIGPLQDRKDAATRRLQAAALSVRQPAQHLMVNFSHAQRAGNQPQDNAAYAALFKRADRLFAAAVADLQPAISTTRWGLPPWPSTAGGLTRRALCRVLPEPQPIDPDVPILRVSSADGGEGRAVRIRVSPVDDERLPGGA